MAALTNAPGSDKLLERVTGVRALYPSNEPVAYLNAMAATMQGRRVPQAVCRGQQCSFGQVQLHSEGSSEYPRKPPGLPHHADTAGTSLPHVCIWFGSSLGSW